MYEHHFGLSKPPFRITPDPAFFFPGGNRGAVLEALIYAVSRGEGIVKVVGEVGSGKTMLCRMLEHELPDDCEIVYLANPRLKPDDIVHAIAFELKLEMTADESRLSVMHKLQEYLLKQHAENCRVIMFVEEAQGMPLESLEEIRMLSNLETSEEKLLQIVLFGQPELDDKLKRHDIRQLNERITHTFELAPFDNDEVRDYLNTRVRASGYRGDGLFNSAAVRELAKHSGGLLRRINVLADKSLLAAFAANKSEVSPAEVRSAAQDSDFSSVGQAQPRRGLLLAGVVIVAVSGLVAWLVSTQENIPQTTLEAPPVAPQAIEKPKLATNPLEQPETPVAAPPAPESPPAARPVASQQRRQVLEVPRISADTGLVTREHIGPRLLPRPQTEALREDAVTAP